ncbi:MAG: hypothetical protein AMS26_12445 [Bacteroides sp. SM23_62]|nr:MAG: hypothetical protein AMS26_12445 [Bacteroides sp. SM23_62]
MKYLLFIMMILIITGCHSSGKNGPQESREICLNGTWDFAKTDYTGEMPQAFTSRVPVPGLVDMASPALDEQDTLYENSLYWYRTKFTLDHKNKQIVRLKINKAKYHTRVYLNNQYVGEYLYNFTPSYFNLKPFLKEDESENDLVIAVGCSNHVPDTVLTGFDFEKFKCIPGIYDDVKIIHGNSPYIENIQLVPDIDKEELRIVATLKTDTPEKAAAARYIIRELSSGKVVARGKHVGKALTESSRVDFTVPLPACRLWSPKTPFLYELELSTRGDRVNTRFAMREFSFDRDSGYAMLNGKPYYLRGTNVCIFRFFEDDSRNALPWDHQWVTGLHQKFKEMNWNSIRYCIGFPPEKWYDIADSLGILIQDEYPLWTFLKEGSRRELRRITSDHLASEYYDWMRERWNHPCVVIWDAQNETITEVTGEAIEKVRRYDLSDRPWDNGWAPPVRETDGIETHPYLFSRYRSGTDSPGIDGPLKDLLTEVRIPGNGPSERSPSPDGKPYDNPIIINEYGWIWLNRDGSATQLTSEVYQKAFPEAKTTEQRREAYARHLGILTEYWRVHRKCAAVMHFCGLSYSRSDHPVGFTSDNFIDIKNLEFEPHFYRYVKPAFNPVGLMVEMWDNQMVPGAVINVPVHLINDRYDDWNDSLSLYILGKEGRMAEKRILCNLNMLDRKLYTLELEFPVAKGEYELIAEIRDRENSIRSIRGFKIK